MTLQEQLCEKMRVEQSAYCLWLTAQPPEEILHHAYEYSVREDIILATEEMNLALAQVRALLKSPAPLADVYKDFSKLETDYMSIVAQCVEDRADDLLKKEQQQNPPKVYRQSVTYAREHGELQQYHASCHLNERCRDEIDAALAQRFDGMRLGAGAVEQVVAEYGLERTKYVLAAAIQTREGDGRISHANREWADSIRTIKDMDRRGFDRSCYYADLQAHAVAKVFDVSQTYGNKPYPIAAVESTKQIEKAIDVMREISPIPVLPKNEVEGFCYDAERQELVFCAAIPPQELLQRLPAEIVMAAAESAYVGISENELMRQTAAAISVEVCGRLGLPMPPDAVQTLEGMKEHIPDGEERRALEKVRETAVTFGDAVCKRLKLERGQPAPQREER